MSTPRGRRMSTGTTHTTDDYEAKRARGIRISGFGLLLLFLSGLAEYVAVAISGHDPFLTGLFIPLLVLLGLGILLAGLWMTKR
jgi:hypothetical protein